MSSNATAFALTERWKQRIFNYDNTVTRSFDSFFPAADVFIKIGHLVDKSVTVHNKRTNTDPKTNSEKISFAIDTAQIPLHLLDLSLSLGRLAGIPKSAALDIAKISILTANSVADLAQAILNKDPGLIVEVIIYRVYDLTQAIYDSTFLSGDARKVINILFPITFIAFTALEIGLALNKEITIERVDTWVTQDFARWKNRIELLFKQDFDDSSLINSIDRWIVTDWSSIRNGLVKKRNKRIQLKATPPAAMEHAEKIGKQIEADFRAITDWKMLTKIPDLITQEEILQPFKCQETSAIIRFAVKPSNTFGIVYDRAAITEWMTNNPTAIPTGWPNDLEVSEGNLETDTTVQYWLDKALELLSKKYVNELHMRQGKLVLADMKASSLPSSNPLTLQEKAAIASDWRRLDTIPDWMQNETLELIKCCLTDKPIRHPIKPAFGAKPHILYDKNALIYWIKNNPGSEPPHWPLNLKFSLGYTVPDSSIQTLIDGALAVEAEKYAFQLEIEQFYKTDMTSKPATLTPLDITSIPSLVREWIDISDSPFQDFRFKCLYCSPIVLYQEEGIIRLNLHLFADNYFMQKFILEAIGRLMEDHSDFRYLSLHENYLLTKVTKDWHEKKLDKFVDKLNEIILHHSIERVELYPDNNEGLIFRVSEDLNAPSITFFLPADENCLQHYLEKIENRLQPASRLIIETPSEIYHKVPDKFKSTEKVDADKKANKKNSQLVTPDQLTNKIEKLKKIFDGELPDHIDLGTLFIAQANQQEIKSILDRNPELEASLIVVRESENVVEQMLQAEELTASEKDQLLVILRAIPDIHRRLSFFEKQLATGSDTSDSVFWKTRRQAELKAESSTVIPIEIYRHLFNKTLQKPGEYPELSLDTADEEVEGHRKWLERAPDAKKRMDEFKERMLTIKRKTGFVGKTDFQKAASELSGSISIFPKTKIAEPIFVKILAAIQGSEDLTAIQDDSQPVEIFRYVKILLQKYPKKKELLGKVIEYFETTQTNELSASFSIIKFRSFIENLERKFPADSPIKPIVYKQLFNDFKKQDFWNPHNTYFLVKKYTSPFFPITNFFETFFDVE